MSRLTFTLGPLTLQPATALRETFRQGYKLNDLRSDILAGLVVGVIALPLSMALAIASGVAPQHGLYTAIVAGAVIAILGGSRVQVSGPTAAFVVILAPISGEYGLEGLALATVMAGLILMLLGALRLGRFIEFIPYPVTTGFTAGIAVVIATLQLKDFLGLRVEPLPPDASYFERVAGLVHGLPTLSQQWPNAVVGFATLAMLILWPRLTKKIPAALVALSVAAVGAYLLRDLLPGVVTIQSRFGTISPPYGIPQAAPAFILPWNEAGPEGGPSLPLTFALVRDLLPYAFAIAMLGGIESLLSAVVSDGMSGHKHNPDAELLAQGTGNLIAPFFGGFAATGAIARTSANVRSGARSPIAALVHSLFVLLSVLALAPLLGYIPMASMAALLLVVAWNMSEARHFLHTLRVSPRADIAVLLLCFALTVVFDMTIAVSGGVMLAALLFMQRMAALTNTRLIGDHHPTLDEPLPKGLLVYEIAGPLFFGAAQRAMSQLHALDRKTRVVLLDLSDVPVMDATGLVNLESAVDRLYRAGIHVILAGVNDQPRSVLAKAHWSQQEGRIEIFSSFNQGFATARALTQLLDEGQLTPGP